MTSKNNLRWALRGALHAAHDRLDASVSRFDLTTSPGMAGFLRFHEASLSRLSLAGQSPATVAAIVDLLARLRGDLQAHSIPIWAGAGTAGLRPVAPLAMDYVIGGSRLGAEVLRRRWSAGEAAQAGVGQAYMTGPRHLHVWEAFCAQSELIGENDPGVPELVADAALIFAHFETFSDCVFEETAEHV